MQQLLKRATCVVLLAAALASCKKGFLDVNDDPNNVTETNITPELIFPQATVASGASNSLRNLDFLNNWVGYWGASGSYSNDPVETAYNLNFSFGESLWRSRNNTLFDLYKTRIKALAKGDSVMAGAAMILSAKLWQEMVDLFGNIPYSEAFQNDRYQLPKYDKAKDIYTSLLQRLDVAKSYMRKTGTERFAKADLATHGDQARWIRFANTLKLRLLIRQSEVAGFDPSAEIAKLKDGGTALNTLQADDDILVNPGYANDVNKQSPFYSNYGLTPSGGEANDNTRANNYFLNILNGASDPRTSRYFKAPEAGGPITGVTYGLGAGNPLRAASSGIGPGLAASPAQDQWIYPAFESLFLEAEAIARGWVSGNAGTKYESAVAASFRFLKVPNADAAAANYLATQPIAIWANAGGTTVSKVKFIAYQKYIAMAGIDAIEAYSDLRRLNMLPNTGYISVNPARLSNTLPVRLPYPQSEYTTNATNVNAEGPINVFTAKLFWQP